MVAASVLYMFVYLLCMYKYLCAANMLRNGFPPGTGLLDDGMCGLMDEEMCGMMDDGVHMCLFVCSSCSVFGV